MNLKPWDNIFFLELKTYRNYSSNILTQMVLYHLNLHYLSQLGRVSLYDVLESILFLGFCSFYINTFNIENNNAFRLFNLRKKHLIVYFCIVILDIYLKQFYYFQDKINKSSVDWKI